MWVVMINLSFVLKSLKRRCYSNQLIGAGLFAKVEFDRLQSLHWHFETECSIAISMRALTPTMMQLHRVKIW